MSTSDRSVSRGRDLYSSGRGGAGNIRQSPSSTSRDARPADGPDDFSVSRGREPAGANVSLSTGRGGVGNMRSPSRGSPLPPRTPVEEQVIKAHLVAAEDTLHSTGRGGVGNIRSSSRSRSRGGSARLLSPVHSTGRGGAGNLTHNSMGDVEELQDEAAERREHLHTDDIHSTGRGGAANLTTVPEPLVEHHTHPHQDYESTGRGGAGNIVHET